MNFRVSAVTLMSILAALAWCAPVHAESASVDVQGVSASDAGSKKQVIPESLARYKKILSDTLFGQFKDAGRHEVTLTSGGKSSASIGAYDLDIQLRSCTAGKCRVEVTIKDGGKAIGQPLSVLLSKGDPRMVAQVGAKDAPTIIFFTLKE